MPSIHTLNKSIALLPHDRALQVILDARARRRTQRPSIINNPAPKSRMTERKMQQKVSANPEKIVASLSAEDKAKLLAALLGG